MIDDNLKEKRDSDVATVANLPKTQAGSQVRRGFLGTAHTRTLHRLQSQAYPEPASASSAHT